MRACKLIAFFVAQMLLFVQPAQGQGTAADYERAAAFQKMGSLVSRLSLTPNWIGKSNQFWYLDRHLGANTFVLVDPDTGSQAPAFDHARLAAELSKVTGRSHAGESLPFVQITFQDDRQTIAFEIDGAGWRCKLADYTCRSGPLTRRTGEVLSPDGRWAVFVRQHNLWIRDLATDAVRPLSKDGDEQRSYASLDMNESLSASIRQRPPIPSVMFSPDSRKLLAFRTDISKVGALTVVESVHGGAPRAHSYPVAMPGDVNVPQAEGFVFDLDNDQVSRINVNPFMRMTNSEVVPCWDRDSKLACFTEEERGYRTIRLHVFDTKSGQVRTPVVEKSATYIPRDTIARVLDGGRNIIWSSERSGWNHLYLVDGHSGAVKNAITSGNWVVRELLHVDEETKTLFFAAGGREPGQDPYYRHLYRVRFDGTGLQRLTPESGDHAVAVSPTGRFFVDTYSRIDAPPVTVLRSTDGRLVREIQRGDVSRLIRIGWRAPEPFKAKAADGKTDVYGAIYRPSNFDPNRRYPVLDAIYPGPQAIRTPKSFRIPGAEMNDQAFAELGFIIVTIDGRGGALRSREFREASYRRLGTAGGLDDHVAVLRQLAERYPQLDLERVGIYGHSGGGYASARALLLYPEFYKVAVSSAGNHDPRSYYAPWGERFQGYPIDATYEAQANPPLAHRLKGKLLLVHGDMDDNVHVSNTLQFADSLIAANKDFDLLILPNRNHGFVNLGKGVAASQTVDPYFLRRRWDYFVKHLLGVDPPQPPE